MKMALKQTVFPLTVLIFIFAVLLTIAVIAIAIFFQKLRKKIEREINAQNPKGNSIVSKMTVKERKKENKYSKNRKRSGDLEPQFYDSPPLRDEQREILQMRTFQNQEDNNDDYDICSSQRSSRDQVTQLAASGEVSRHAKTMPRALQKEDSYIECIGDDEALRRMTTFQSAYVSSKREPVTQSPRTYKSHATTMPRTLMKEDSYIECIGDNKALQTRATVQSAKVYSKREPVTQSPRMYKSNATTLPRTLERDGIDGECSRKVKPSHGAAHASSPIIEKGGGHGVKVAFRDTVTQQHVSRNTNFTSRNGHDGEEMYEVMNNNSEIYENTGYVDDSSEDVYGNQEIIEQENKRRSQTNMVPVSQHSGNWGSQTAKYHEENYGEEVYENQEIIEQQRKISAQRDANNHFELYENYVPEEMYENC